MQFSFVICCPVFSLIFLFGWFSFYFLLTMTMPTTKQFVQLAIRINRLVVHLLLCQLFRVEFFFFSYFFFHCFSRSNFQQNENHKNVKILILFHYIFFRVLCRFAWSSQRRRRRWFNGIFLFRNGRDDVICAAEWIYTFQVEWKQHQMPQQMASIRNNSVQNLLKHSTHWTHGSLVKRNKQKTKLSQNGFWINAR